MRFLSLIAVALLAAVAPARTLAAQATLTPTPSSLQAAREVLEITNAKSVMRATMQASFDAQIEQMPAMEPFRPVMEEWADKYLSWDIIAPHLAEVYAQTFTEQELKELIAFYRTPLGRKVAAETPELSRRGAVVGAKIAAEHMPELQQMIQAKMAELQRRPPQ